MDDTLTRAISAIGDDHRSGASALLWRGLAVLKRAAAAGPDSLERTAVQVCRAQPSMGAIWNAACVALDDSDADTTDHPARSLDRFQAEVAAAEQAVGPAAARQLSRFTPEVGMMTTRSRSHSPRARVFPIRDHAPQSAKCSGQVT